MYTCRGTIQGLCKGGSQHLPVKTAHSGYITAPGQ